MKRLLLASTALCAALATAHAQQAQVLVPTVPALGFTPVKVINPADPAYGLSASNNAVANRIALQAVATAACASGGNALIDIPAGVYLVDVGGGTPLAVPCTGVSIRGVGGVGTQFNLSGNGDFIVYSPPAGRAYGGAASLSGFRTFRTDSPTSGRGIALDHATSVNVRDVQVVGSFIDLECNTCLNSTVMSTQLTGFETQAGSAMLWVHRSVAYATAGAASIGATVIPFSGQTGAIYYGQKVLDNTTGGAVAAGTTVTGWTASTVTLSTPLVGGVLNGDALELGDPNPATFFVGGGAVINSGTGKSPFSYDYATLIQDCDGCWISDVHTAWARHASLYVQPEHSDDQIFSINTAPNTYFDDNATGCIDFEPYGGFTTTVSGVVAPGATSVTLASAAPANANGYRVLANGVDVGTTVSTGQGTTSIVLSAVANALGLADGESITLYPVFTGSVASNNLYGFCQGSLSNAVIFNDPAVTGQKVQLYALNTTGSAFVMNAGSNFDVNLMVTANNRGNGLTNSTVLIQGNASNVTLAGQLNPATFAPAYAVEQNGQASRVSISALTVLSGASATLDVTNSGVNAAPISSGGFRSYTGHANLTQTRAVAGNTFEYIDGGLTVSGFSNLANGWLGGNSANYIAWFGAGSGSNPLLQATGSDTDISLGLTPKGAGVVKVSTMLRLTTAYSAAGTALPACAAGLAGAVAYVSDATAPTYRGAYTSGGTVKTLVMCDGSSWTTH